MGRLLTLQTGDSAALLLSLWARTSFQRLSEAAAALDESIEQTKSLALVFARRRQIHLVHRVDLALFSLYSARYGVSKAKFAMHALSNAGICEPKESHALYLALCERITSLLGSTTLTTSEIAERLPEIRRRAPFGTAKAAPLEVDPVRCVLESMAVSGRIVCAGRDRFGSDGTWANRSAWFAGEEPSALSGAEKTALVSRYLSVFGPATLEDIAAWTELSQEEISAALRATSGVEVRVEGWPGERWVLGGELDRLSSHTPDRVGVALLPALDPVALGYQDLSPFLGRPAQEGDQRPTVWADGRVVGRWSLSQSGEVALELQENTSAALADEIREEGRRLQRAIAARTIATQVSPTNDRELRTP